MRKTFTTCGRPVKRDGRCGIHALQMQMDRQRERRGETQRATAD